MRTRTELLAALDAAGVASVMVGNNEGWAVVAPALGARVMGLGIGEENALWSAPRIVRAGWTDGGNAGGLRTWIAPEGGLHGFFYRDDPTRWSVPLELDPGSYVGVADTDGWQSWECRLTARCLDGMSFPIAITRSVRIARDVSVPGIPVHVEIRHMLTNRGDAVLDRRIGLWCIAQCPCAEPARILIPLAPGHGSGCIHPYFAPLPDGILELQEHAAVISTMPGVKYKVGCGAPAAAGGIAFIGRRGSRRSLLALRFSVDPGGSYLDHPPASGDGAPGDPVQAYNDPGTADAAFCELEAHAHAARLEPGESQAAAVDVAAAFGDEAMIEEAAGAALGLRLQRFRNSLPR